VGFLNPFLYANAAKGVVQDVASGTNAIKNTIKGYNAGPGWDAFTRFAHRSARSHAVPISVAMPDLSPSASKG
jgi:hypothetical protein